MNTRSLVKYNISLFPACQPISAVFRAFSGQPGALPDAFPDDAVRLRRLCRLAEIDDGVLRLLRLLGRGDAEHDALSAVRLEEFLADFCGDLDPVALLQVARAVKARRISQELHVLRAAGHRHAAGDEHILREVAGLQDLAGVGDVLVLGLRMGYYSYLVSLKAKVKSVTIIENDQTLIDMFETLILPQFKKAQKIKIIKADAFDYISELEDGKYRHCFVDNMEDKNDVETYFKMKALCKRFKKTKFFYNFEPEFVYKMREQVFAEIVKEANKIFEGELSSLKLAEPWGDDMPYSKKYLEKVCREVKIEDPIAVISYCQPKYVLKFINKVRL